MFYGFLLDYLHVTESALCTNLDILHLSCGSGAKTMTGGGGAQITNQIVLGEPV